MKKGKAKVTYSVVAHKNPLKSETGTLYYAQAQARGEIGLDMLCDRIQQRCTIHKADVKGVLVALETEMSNALADGMIVRLGEFGSFKVSVSSKGAASRKVFNERYIRGSRYLFHPGRTLKDVQKKMEFERVARKKKVDVS